MSNEAARELISVAQNILETASTMIDPDEKTYIFNYPLQRCPDEVLMKWQKDHGEELASLSASLEIQHELKSRERLKIKIVGVK